MAGTYTKDAVEEFLFREAEFLDQWNLKEWEQLFTDDARYLVAPLAIDNPKTADPQAMLFLVADDRTRIGERVTRLLKKGAHAEYPHSRTRHMLGNVLIEGEDAGEITVAANFTTHRARNREVVTYMGRTYWRLAKTSDGLRIREKRACLDLEILAPQGSLAIIL